MVRVRALTLTAGCASHADFDEGTSTSQQAVELEDLVEQQQALPQSTAFKWVEVPFGWGPQLSPSGIQSTGWVGYQAPSLAWDPDALEPNRWKLFFVQDKIGYLADHDDEHTGPWNVRTGMYSWRGFTDSWIGTDGGGWFFDLFPIPRVTRFLSVQMQQ